MKEAIVRVAILFGSVFLLSSATAQPLVWRGDVVLHLSDMDARMSRFPEFERADYSRMPENLARTMSQLLINRALAEEARELGLEQNDLVKKDLELAAEEVLAIHRVNLLLRDEAMPDFEPYAREKYLADPSAWKIPESRTIEHVLIKTDRRSEEEALDLSSQVLSQARAGTAFSELVQQYSEDPSKERNQGQFVIVNPGDFQPEFSEGAAALKEVGDFSEPVKTAYGYHIIRLVQVVPARQQAFEQVRDEIVRNLRNEYRKTARLDYLTSVRMRLGEEQGDMDLLMTLPSRYGGRPEEAPGD